MEEDITRLEALKKLREPFKENQIGKLPKPTQAQTDEVKKDFKKGARCNLCGGWHHPGVVHLDYVGHAALTDRLLNVDPLWNWEPIAVDETGSPLLDKDGGMWIRLTICGVTRLGYGDALGKSGPNAVKERIGDALRNAGMRFGMALDLWHKGELHIEEEREEVETVVKMSSDFEKEADLNCKTVEDLGKWYKASLPEINKMEKLEITKINSYVSQLKALILEQSAPKGETVICPETNKEVLKYYCGGKVCLSGGPAFLGSKLDLSAVK